MSDVDTKPAPVKTRPPEPVAAVAEKPERWIPASESRFMTSSEFVSPLVSYMPEAGTPAEHLLRPEYWASLTKLRARVRIWVEAEDGAYIGELYVLKAGQGYAKVCWLPGYPMAVPGMTADPTLPDGYVIEWRGHVVKHRIVRLKDGHVLKQGMDTSEEAAMWLREHKRMLQN